MHCHHNYCHSNTCTLQRLEKLIIPHCKRVPNKTLTELLGQNPSLLHLDISNKEKPKVDAGIVSTIAQSCRNLTVLKLSDYRVEDPKVLLVLCGRRLVDPALFQREERGIQERREGMRDWVEPLSAHGKAYRPDSKQGLPSSFSTPPFSVNVNQGAINNEEYLLSVTSQPSSDIPLVHNSLQALSLSSAASCSPALRYSGQVKVVTDSCACEADDSGDTEDQRSGSTLQVAGGSDSEAYLNAAWMQNRQAGPPMVVAANHEAAQGACASREEQLNALGRVEDGVNEVQDGDKADEEAGEEEGEQNEEQEQDMYETDEPIFPLDVEDCSNAFGCLELETLWLDYVNLTDQVAAVLMQSLPRLKDLNVCDTNICNPWRLLDPLCTPHLKYLERLDVRSTALSKTALEMIPRCHPDLQKLSISSTMLPPPTYANIGHLTGVAELELIGGQFYIGPPEDIFTQGISPAVSSIGKHLVSLNLTYFAHVEFDVIPPNCPKLEYLDLSFTCIFSAYPCASLGQHCPHLSSLNLDFSRIEAHEAKEDEADLDPPSVPENVALESMIGQPPNIEELQLGGLCMEDGTLQKMFPGYFHPLRVLNVSRCRQLTIQGVRHVWERCPYIHTVDMTHCKSITVNDFHAFRKMCFELRPRFKVEGRIEWQ